MSRFKMHKLSQKNINFKKDHNKIILFLSCLLYCRFAFYLLIQLMLKCYLVLFSLMENANLVMNNVGEFELEVIDCTKAFLN